jgi:excisionase family DNA binding protein
MSQAEGELLTVQEVAKHLKVDEKTVRRWIINGDLVAINLGKGYRIYRSDLDAFIEKRRTKRNN